MSDYLVLLALLFFAGPLIALGFWTIRAERKRYERLRKEGRI
jgi:hypothetical protein